MAEALEPVSLEAAALKSGWLTQGEEARRLSEVFQQLFPDRHVVAVASGTAGVHLALLALDLGAGDEVILPGLAPPALANLVVFSGGKPIFADIAGPELPVIGAEQVAPHLSTQTRAVIVVHKAGYPAPLDALHTLTQAHGVTLIEECWQALGARAGGRPLGGVGRFAVFALHDSVDGGGIVVCAGQDDRRRIEDLRSSAMRPDEEGFEHPLEAGLLNGYRIDEAAAAAGLRLLDGLADEIAARERITATVRASLKDTGHTVAFPPGYLAEAQPSYDLLPFVARAGSDVPRLVRAARGLGLGHLTPTALHRLPPYSSRLPRLSLPATEDYCSRAVEFAVGSSLLDLVRSPDGP